MGILISKFGFNTAENELLKDLTTDLSDRTYTCRASGGAMVGFSTHLLSNWDKDTSGGYRKLEGNDTPRPKTLSRRSGHDSEQSFETLRDQRCMAQWCELTYARACSMRASILTGSEGHAVLLMMIYTVLWYPTRPWGFWMNWSIAWAFL